MRVSTDLNLSLRVQIEGWKSPMNEADAQRELDIQQAMAVIDADTPKQTSVTGTDVPADPLAGWKLRWQQEGLTMPSVDVTLREFAMARSGRQSRHPSGRIHGQGP